MTESLRRQEVLDLIAAPDLAPVARRGSDAEWSDRLRIAGERLHPWIAHRLAAAGLLAALPAGPRGVLRSASSAATLWELRRRASFGALADALATAGIPFIVLKGMALAYSVYPLATVRPMGDMDLWVAPGRRAEAERAFGALGWRTPRRHRAHPHLADAETKLELAGSRLLLELHDHPHSLHWARSGGDELWRRAASASIAGREVRVLEPLDQLTHLIAHLGAKTGYVDGLLGLLDVTLASRALADEQAWGRLAQLHLAAGVAPSSALALSLARDLLRAPVPRSYFEALGGADTTGRLRAAAMEQLWERDAGSVTGVDRAVADGRSGALAAVARYLRSYHATPFREGQGRLAALATRLRYDLVDRLPRYLRAWRRGEFGRDRLARRGAMFGERRDLIAALEAADHEAASPLTPAGPSSSAAPSAPR